MRQLEDLVRFEIANSSVAFRERAYVHDERPLLLRDLVALANAAVEGPRFLSIGVRDNVGGKREIPGIERADWAAFKVLLSGAVGESIEPPLNITLRSLEIDGKLVGLLCLMSCEDPPYLLSEKAGGRLPAGCGWIRRGTAAVPLLRADLKKMFEAKFAVADVFELAMGFPGDPPAGELTLPALPLDALPSVVAAQKLHKMLAAQESSKAIMGRTQTQFSRLVHAQVFGVDKPYERHSEDSLRILIAETADDYRVADAHYRFEVRAHKLEVVVRNGGAEPLANAVLQLTLPRLDGIEVAEHVYTPSGVASKDGYPLVTMKAHTINIEAAIAIVPARATARAFREAPRLSTQPIAVGKAIAVDCVLHARELREPLRETLVIRIVEPAKRR